MYTLGCKLNYAETSSIGKQFLERGFQVVDFSDPADVCIINTCSVTEHADRECRQIIRRALRTSPNPYIIVVGCYAQLEPEEIASIDGVDLVLGASEKFRVFDYASDFQEKTYPQIFTSPIETVSDFGSAHSGGFGSRTRAFLKVQDGCDFHCAFCTIPLARGASRSQSIEVTVAQARELVIQGYKEIVLTGVNVGDYGKKSGTSLLALLRELEKVDGLDRIRVSSIEPNLLTRELLDFVIQSEHVCNHFHIPLQSGHDDILKCMRRRYMTNYYRNLIYSIKEKDQEAGIGVDVIVGFPGETDTHFEDTYKFLLELPISYLHVFSYSERPNTPAANFSGTVEPNVRYKRSEMLRILSAKKRHQFYSDLVGKVFSVLVESDIHEGKVFGFTENYARVALPMDLSLANEIVDVRITGIEDEYCVGEELQPEKSSETSSSFVSLAVNQ